MGRYQAPFIERRYIASFVIRRVQVAVWIYQAADGLDKY